MPTAHVSKKNQMQRVIDALHGCIAVDSSSKREARSAMHNETHKHTGDTGGKHAFFFGAACTFFEICFHILRSAHIAIGHAAHRSPIGTLALRCARGDDVHVFAALKGRKI